MLYRRRGSPRRRPGSRTEIQTGSVRSQPYPRAGGGEFACQYQAQGSWRPRKAGRTCNFIRFRRAPVPTLMILLANSTPMVCDDRTRHSFLTKRCRRQDLMCAGDY